MKLQTIAVAKLGNEDTHGICLATVQLFKPESALLDTTSQSALSLLEEKTNELGKQHNRQRANSLTKDIKALNKTTDSIWKEIKATLTRTSRSVVNTEKAKAAALLTDFLKPYWDSETQSTSTQTANFAEMFGKYYASADMQAKATLVAITEALDLLHTKNTGMATLWHQRNDIQGNISSTPSASNVKRSISSTYSRFCQSVENQNTFAPTPELNALIGKLNEVRAKYSALIGVRAAARQRVKKGDTK